MSRSAHARRRLPPGVLDIHAPQHPLPIEDPQSPPDAQHAAPPPDPVAQDRPRRPRPLTASEGRLARYLESHLYWGFGAKTFVRKHGAPAILDALHDGVVIWDELNTRWTVNPRLRNPAAFLNHLLKAP